MDEAGVAVASCMLSPDELANPNTYMTKYCKCGITELLDNKLVGVHVSMAPAGT